MIDPITPRKMFPLQNLALTSSITVALPRHYQSEDPSVNVGQGNRKVVKPCTKRCFEVFPLQG
jgi:hypothetical protein